MIPLNFVPKIIPNSKLTCVFLHDFISSSVSFSPLTPFLQHTSYYLDLRNHGFSPKAPLMSYPLLSLDLKGFLKGLDLSSKEKRLVLLGHGLGGKVIMNLLNDEDEELFEKIRAFIVLDTAPIDYMKDRKFSWPADLFYLLEDLGDIKLRSTSFEKIKAEITKICPNKHFIQIILQNITQDDDSMNYSFKFSLSSIKQNFRDLMSFPQILKKGFDSKRLVVVGERSEHVRDDVFPSFANIFNEFDPVKEVRYVKNAGHYIQADQPKELMNIINEFLSKL